MSPLVTVVILNWNGWKDTIACVDSLLESDYDNLRIVIVDNHSSNDSVERLRHRFPRVKLLLSSHNLGFSGGCNIGIEEAIRHDSEYVWLVNNDAVVLPDTLSKLMSRATPADVGIVGGVLYDLDDAKELQTWGGGVLTGLFSTPRFLKGPPKDSRSIYITGACLLIKTSVIRAVGSLDASFFMYWEDVDWSFRVAAAGYKLVIADDAVVYHKRCASTGQLSPRSEFMSHEAFVQFYVKHWRRNPLAIGMLGVNVIKRLLKGRPQLAMAVVQGAIQGTRKKLASTKPLNATVVEVPYAIDESVNLSNSTY